MSSYIQNFKKFQPLLAELVARDIKIKYRRSVLGVLWTLLNPLFMMIILSVVFSSIFKFDIENFPLYILSGQLIFNFFNDATTSSMTSIIGSAALIKKVYVPKYLFVIARVFSSFINLMASLVALILVMVAMRAPVIYPMSILPETVRIVVNINPLTNMVQMFRNVMFYNTLPTFSSIVLGMAEVAVVLVLGTYVFYKNQDEFILNI